MTLAERIRQKAVELGFDLAGIAPAQATAHADFFRDWLKAGRHAGMSWLARDARARTDPRVQFHGARSVIAVGVSCFVANPPADLWNDPSRGRIARYAWGQDYHDVLMPWLRTLAVFVRQESHPEAQTAICLDTGPLLERDVAASAGLGFIGRNNQLINPRFGSYVLLGEIVTDIELDYDAEARSADHRACGRCRRCLNSCPTQAFADEYALDSRRCISYLTIENKGSIPEELRPLMGNWIFGCDECQEVCPWVKRHAQPGRATFLRFEPDFAAPHLLDLLKLDDASFRMRYLGSALMRARRRGLLRNACVALGNWGSREALPALETAARDPEPLIREHAEWAIGRIDA